MSLFVTVIVIVATIPADGVTVAVLVWDKKTSNKFLPGISGTFDEYSRDFFKKTKVMAEFVHRRTSKDNEVTDLAYKTIFRNFEERLRKQTRGNSLAELSDAKFDLNCAGAANAGDVWLCKILRSITEDSARFDADRSATLSSGGCVTDTSIERAYVNLIRKAQKFIYIESQYFLGSAFAWANDTDTCAQNLIPYEITNQIVEKNRAGKRLVVYVVLPMFPEGDPSSMAMQAILHWQHHTIRIMYARIAKELEETKTKAIPTDYLNFYCLGTRESAEPEGLDKPKKGSIEERLRQKRRFMVYVHSKMMIVDDSYIIVGSANINERSLNGARDSEISMQAFQDNHVIKDGAFPQGQVHAFRKALWAEHMSSTDALINDPNSIECVKKVNEMAESNWDTFTARNTNDTEGYLMTYPYKIANDGEVKELKDHEDFPDFDASFKGKHSIVIPDVITT